MKNDVIIQELNRYKCQTIEDAKNALREIGQRIVLSGLNRGGIFNHCVFYGGTSLRLLYNLDRFSEDLDFTLVHRYDPLPFENYLNFAVKEMNDYGFNASCSFKNKNVETSVISGYVKFNLKEAVDLFFENNHFNCSKEENISIKVEIETKFYDDFAIEYKPLLFPAFFKVATFNLPTLFSCKLLAVLNRGWKNRVKGRDYFDFLFYFTNQVTPNYPFLGNALGIKDFDKRKLISLLQNKFETINFNNVLNDVLPFVDPNSRFIPLFKKDIFIELLKEIK